MSETLRVRQPAQTLSYSMPVNDFLCRSGMVLAYAGLALTASSLGAHRYGRAAVPLNEPEIEWFLTDTFVQLPKTSFVPVEWDPIRDTPGAVFTADPVHRMIRQLEAVKRRPSPVEIAYIIAPLAGWRTQDDTPLLHSATLTYDRAARTIRGTFTTAPTEDRP